MKYFFQASIAGFVLALILFWAAFEGYGVIIYYLWPPNLILLLLLALLNINRLPCLRLYGLSVLILIGLSGTGAVIGHWGRFLVIKSKCKALEPLLQLIEQYHADHGKYPVNLNSMKGFAFAQRDSGLLIEQGKIAKNGLIVDGFDGVDARLYLNPNQFTCIVPVTKIIPMSFTRFYVFNWTSGYPSWKYEKMIQWLTVLDR